MNKEFFRALRLLERDKGIPIDYMKEKVESALQAAVKKETGTPNVRVVLDDAKLDVKVYRVLAVVDIEEEERKAKEEYERREAERAAAALEAQAENGEEDTKAEPSLKKDEPDVDEEGNAVYVYNKPEGSTAKGEEKKERTSYFRFNPSLHITVEEAQKKSKRYKAGDSYEIEMKTKTFGRISAHAAKQVIIQAIKEAERGMMIREYEGKKEEIVTGVVSRVDPISGDATIEIGKNVVKLMRKEQIPGEVIREGDVIKVYVLEVKKESEKGPAVVLSRTHAGFVKRLFELEVPETRDGLVDIRSVAREAGSRTKIAVESRDPNVDPIGACIGARGVRKNNITKELSGEKIDIVRYSDDAKAFIEASLAPAEIVAVRLAEDGSKACVVLVEDDQLSLAIGKKGQNARLVAKLTGYKIDIKSVNAPDAYDPVVSAEAPAAAEEQAEENDGE